MILIGQGRRFDTYTLDTSDDRIWKRAADPSNTEISADEVLTNQPFDVQNAIQEYQNTGGVIQPPRKPKIFKSPETLRAYLNKLNEYFITIGRPSLLIVLTVSILAEDRGGRIRLGGRRDA
ncbi:unnamed protein product [Echinostoma caproni]|uniref:PSCyt2 domain-containing protein n=1 Tax=Echinostoma caproni TaxID=27848 RepID=A0A183AFD5_9TREM|nr:unnamed protein product [Echinostoma caproni]